MNKENSNIITKQIVTGIVDTAGKKCPFGTLEDWWLSCAPDCCGAYIDNGNVRGCMRLITEKTECTFVAQPSKNAEEE